MVQDISTTELKERLDKGENLIIIDVREPYEYEEFNINGKLIPLSTLPSVIDDLEDLKDQEVIVHCRSGARSASAKDYMIKNGFSNVRNLKGGMLEWQAKYGS